MKTLKSILTVLAGFALDFVLSSLTDFALESGKIFPSAAEQMKAGLVWWVLVIALCYRLIYTIAAGWLTARLAPDKPIGHAIVLGGIGTLAALAGAIAMWSLGSQWYPILLIVTALPCTWLGGRLAEKKAAAD